MNFNEVTHNDRIKNKTSPRLTPLNSKRSRCRINPRLSSRVQARGKTRVLTTRMAWLMQTGQASPASILAVTFTNKAAKEMTTRLSSLIPINTRHMWVGTFHGLCNRFLRAHYRDANLPATFQILDTQDQLSAIKRLLKSMNIDTERYPPKQVQYFINGSKEEGLRAHDIEPSDPVSTPDAGNFRSV